MAGRGKGQRAPAPSRVGAAEAPGGHAVGSTAPAAGADLIAFGHIP